MAAVHLSISGRVQGVGFRAFTAQQAELLQLTGWVRNRRDGSVEAVVCGADEAVEVLIETVERVPAGARVDEITRRAWTGTDPQGFSVLSTA